MSLLDYSNNRYQTAPIKASALSGMFPGMMFYSRFIAIVWRASSMAKMGKYDSAAWDQSSLEVLRALEKSGVSVEVTGVEYVEQLDSPCVIIANHMSVMETTVLPVIINPVREITFIVKETLLNYPVFKHVMRSRNPIAVTRVNPRQDLKAVLDGGVERLEKGISIVVFPQTTRTGFDPAQFNTIGVKLAKRANVPILPVALKTDAWGNGSLLKDFGRIDPGKKVRFAFRKPMMVEGKGKEENLEIIDFIQTKLKEWGVSAP